MLTDKMNLTGKVLIEVNGKPVLFVNNLITTAGKGYVASRMEGVSATVMSHMAIGSGTTGAAIGDTTLQTELGRVALTSTVVSTNTVTYTASFPAGTGTGTITEAGIFNDPTTGTLLARTVFGAVTKNVNDSMTITWVVTVS